MEDRALLSSFQVFQQEIQTGPNSVLPAVGHYVDAGVTKPFIAVTYIDNSKGQFGVAVLEPDTLGHFNVASRLELGSGAAFSNAEGIVVGNFTGSGHDDLAVATNGDGTTSGEVSLFKGHGDGTFEFAGTLKHPDGTDAFLPTYLATTVFKDKTYLFVSDFTGQGPNIPDNQMRVVVYAFDAAGNAAVVQQLGSVFRPEQILVGDFNGDCIPDLAVANKNSDESSFTSRFANSVTIFQGAGDGTFLDHPQNIRIPSARPNVPSGPIGLAAGDFDHDGHVDLAVADYGTTVRPAGTVSILDNRSQKNVRFAPRVARTLAVGRQIANIVTVNLGEASPGLVTASFSPDRASHPDHRLFVLHSIGKRPGTFLFRREVINLSTPPGTLLTAPLTGNPATTKQDLIVVNWSSISIFRNRTSATSPS
jgi:hypothetical protein